MTYRARNIVLAVALAVVAALLTGWYVTTYKRAVQHGEQHVSVYVAAKDIPAGTSGADVASSGYLRKVDVPRRAVVPGAISSPKQVENEVTADKVYAGEQVTSRRFTSKENAGVRSFLQGPMRAVELSGDAQQVLAGTLKAGDHVDLVSNLKYPEGGPHYDRLVLRDLLVLQAPDVPKAAGKLDSGSQSYSVMVRATDSQMPKLWYATRNADAGQGGSQAGWSLVLRPTTNPTDNPDLVERAKTVVEDGLSAYQLHRGGLH